MWRWERDSLGIKIKNKNRGLKTAAEISQKKEKKRKKNTTTDHISHILRHIFMSA